jgi:hypothetical protein
MFTVEKVGQLTGRQHSPEMEKMEPPPLSEIEPPTVLMNDNF